MCLSGCALLSLGWHVDTGNGEFVAVHVAKNKMDKQKIYPQVFFFQTQQTHGVGQIPRCVQMLSVCPRLANT